MLAPDHLKARAARLDELEANWRRDMEELKQALARMDERLAGAEQALSSMRQALPPQ
jgi:hypothetical protein